MQPARNRGRSGDLQGIPASSFQKSVASPAFPPGITSRPNSSAAIKFQPAAAESSSHPTPKLEKQYASSARANMGGVVPPQIASTDS